jgi:F-type H+-transporting ATPase subunit delta
LSGAVAQRYAAALADLALERKIAEKVQRDLNSFAETYFSSSDLRNTLESPAINHEIKNKVIEAIAEKMGLDVAIRNFIFLVVDHRRAEMLPEIQAAFRNELNLRLGIEEAEVTSARELTAAEKKELTSVLEQRTGKKIEARFEQNKTLLGGAVVKLGSTIYDGSVREQLDRLREQLETE